MMGRIAIQRDPIQQQRGQRWMSTKIIILNERSYTWKYVDCDSIHINPKEKKNVMPFIQIFRVSVVYRIGHLVYSFISSLICTVNVDKHW